MMAEENVIVPILCTMVDRLAEDHENAKHLAKGLPGIFPVFQLDLPALAY